MNTKILATALLAATVGTVVLYPTLRGNAAPQGLPPLPPVTATAAQVEAVFVLDTTGSMSGLIDAAKEKIWSIAATMAQADPAPQIRIGLVGYRDRGDAYVTKVVDLSADLDSMYAALMDFAAGGGGDTPESVNRALYEAVHDLSWSQNPDSYKVVFLVGDAPPQSYQDEPHYQQIVAAAAAKGIVVNTIQCGSMPETTGHWQRIAALGGGRYFRVEQAGGAIAIATPYDAEIARLAAELDGTRLFYGSREAQEEMAQKRAATDKLVAAASVGALARRGAFNASASGAANLAGDHDLVAAVEEGRVTLDAVPAAELPAAIAALPPTEREQAVAAAGERRRTLQAQIAALAHERDDYLAAKVAETDGAERSLDMQIYEAVRTQAAPKGLRYDNGPRF